ncbi:Transposase IS200 like [Yersinia intermedia]|nr:Transposase IS200 like [Yersinia intermedia]CNH39016.1 Transposase IS200 like [Yersinia intermedia]
MNSEGSHVHILVASPPKLTISVLVKSLKSTSSCYVRILNIHIRKQIMLECSGHVPMLAVALVEQHLKH